MNTQRGKMSTQTLTMGAILTALVVLLQLLSANLKVAGMFSITLTLIPIIVGAATCGSLMGAWLGLVFGLVVLFSGGAEPFLTLNPPATLFIVFTKSIACGYIAGIVYKLLSKRNQTLAVAIASVVCPVVNTGIFTLGTVLFFSDYLSALIVLIVVNFSIELGINIILNPIIVRLLNIKKHISK